MAGRSSGAVRSAIGALVVAGMLVTAAGTALGGPPRYTVTVIPNPPGSGVFPAPRAMNDLGWVTGNWGDGAFLYKPGEGSIRIGYPAGLPFVGVKDINNRGEIAGVAASQFIKLETEAQVFRWTDGVFQMYPQLAPGRVARAGFMNDLGRMIGSANDGSFIGFKALEYTLDGQIVQMMPGTGTYDQAVDINNAGQILGIEVRGAFRWRWPEEPQPFILPSPGAELGATVVAMNDAGDVVGSVRETSHPESSTAAIYTDDLGWRFLPPGGRFNVAVSINSAREVVGNTRDGSPIGDHGWRWTTEDGYIPLSNLTDPADVYSVWFVSDINEHGQIACNGENRLTGQSVGMVLTPVAPCVVDLSGDGLIDFSDFLSFLTLFDARDPRVDFTGDGLVDFADYLEFLNLYEEGC